MRRIIAVVIGAIVLVTAYCPAQEQTQPAGAQKAPNRPAEWAQPIELPGCPNLHKVSDNLYRGAQPTAEGMKQLEKLGIKTVVNLRSFNSDSDLLGGTKLRYESIPFKAWHPEDEDMVRFLKIVIDKNNGPVFVHCQHGADRTGVACAVYRIAVQGWTKEAAAREAEYGGYGFHKVWRNLLDYINKLDIDAVKRKTGLAPAAP